MRLQEARDRHTQGGCHCGRVRFEVDAPSVSKCSTAIARLPEGGFPCTDSTRVQFRPASGADALTTYEFNTGTAKHLFCAHCGVKSFYVPRSHPDGYSVNARCLDDGTVEAMVVTPFEGRHWEDSARKAAFTTPG